MYEKSQASITHILDATQRLFVAHSYNDITMTTIAQEAKMTKGAIYHHFKGKEALFLKMMLRNLDRLQRLLRQAVVANATSRQRLAHLTALYLAQPLEEQHVIQLVRRDANRFSGKTRQQLVAAYQNALPQQIEAIIADGMAAGEIAAGDARLLSRQFVALVEVYLSDYARQQFDNPSIMANHLTALFFNGVAYANGVGGAETESRESKNGANVF